MSRRYVDAWANLRPGFSRWITGSTRMRALNRDGCIRERWASCIPPML